jgi:hypothetical protein
VLFAAQFSTQTVKPSACFAVFDNAAEQMLDREFAHYGQCKEVVVAMKSTEKPNDTNPFASINRSFEMG